MASKRKFHFDRKQDPSMKESGNPAPADPAGPNAANVDAMVSEFLAELKDISSEIDDLRTTRTNEVISRPKEPTSQSVPDLREIESEIEHSLSELERLKSMGIVPEERPVQSSESEPAVNSDGAEERIIGPEQEPEGVNSGTGQELPAGNLNMFELYRNSLSSPNQRSFWRRKGLFIGSTAAALLLVFAVSFFREKQAAVDQTPDQGSGPVLAQEPALTLPLPVAQPAVQPESTPVTAAATPAASIVANAEFNTRSTPRPKRASDRSGVETTAAIPHPEAGAALEAAVQRQPNTPLPPVPPQAISTSAVITQMRPVPPSPTFAETESAPLSAPISAAAPVRKQEQPPAADQQRTSAPVTSRPVVAQAIQRVSPVYPGIARAQKVSGVVEVEADVNERGDVVRAKAISGPVLLRGAAEEALMKWKFRPASLHGNNVSSKARVKITFSIK